jgi:hypothetical protein
MSGTINDEKYEFYCTALGLPYNCGKNIDDLEYDWLAAQVSGYITLTGLETNCDLWSVFLRMLGYPESLGTIMDRTTAWLQGDYGYTGTINDMLLQYYSEFEVAAWLLTDVEGNQLKDVDGNFLMVLATS